MAVDNNNNVNNNATGQLTGTHFNNILQGGTNGFIPSDEFGNDPDNSSFQTTCIITNVVNNYADQIYKAAASGGTLVTLAGNQADLSGSAGAFQAQSFFQALKSAQQAVASIVSSQDKEVKNITDIMR